MSTLTDVQVADVARKAGFVGPQLVTSIATALAASGAIPSYDHAIWPGPVAHYKGLWGLDVVEWPDYAGRELTNPYTAARAAYELTQRGDFSWCPTWRAGTDRWYETRARNVAGRLPGIEPATSAVGVNMHRRRVQQETAILSRKVDAITRSNVGR